MVDILTGREILGLFDDDDECCIIWNGNGGGFSSGRVSRSALRRQLSTPR